MFTLVNIEHERSRTVRSQTPFKSSFTRQNKKTSTFFAKRAIKKTFLHLKYMEVLLLLGKTTLPKLYLRNEK